MSYDLPQPLTPPDCDLRGLEWMPLYGHRLFASDFDTHASNAAFRAAVNLWWAAWNQVPAASLPDDPMVLCRLAGLGRSLKQWRAISLDALRGFEPCADGRLYHRTLASIALDSWEHRRKERARRLKWKEKAAKGDGAGDVAETADRTRHDRIGDDRTGNDRTGVAPHGRCSANGLRQVRAADLGLQASTGTAAVTRRHKPQDVADRDMVRWLNNELGIEPEQAWQVVLAARDPQDKDHVASARQLEKLSREHRLGWFAHDRDVA